MTEVRRDDQLLFVGTGLDTEAIQQALTGHSVVSAAAELPIESEFIDLDASQQPGSAEQTRAPRRITHPLGVAATTQNSYKAALTPTGVPESHFAAGLNPGGAAENVYYL